jgi:hypothetical protein
MEQSVGAVDEFRRRASLAAEGVTGRMLRIGLDRDQPPVLDH